MKYITKAKFEGTTEVRAPLFSDEDATEPCNAIKSAKGATILSVINSTKFEYTDIEGIICKATVKIGENDYVSNVVKPVATTSTGYVVEICDDDTKEGIGVYANIYKGAIRFSQL